MTKPILNELPSEAEKDPLIQVQDFSVSFGGQKVLQQLSLSAYPSETLSLIGPTGSGKSTLLRCLTRLNDTVHDFQHSGRIFFQGQDIYGKQIEVSWLRRRMGMVTSTPTVLPYSIFDNIAFALRLEGLSDSGQVHLTVQHSLRQVDLWDQVEHRLDAPALRLTNVQQQLLCLARVLALSPAVLLLDKPCLCLDVVASSRFEDVLLELKKRHSIIMATHDNRQAARTSDRVVFLLEGTIIESGPTREVYFNPKDGRTLRYIQERF